MSECITFYFGDYMDEKEFEEKLLALDSKLNEMNKIIEAKDSEVKELKQRNDQLVERLLTRQDTPAILEPPVDPQAQYEDALNAIAGAIRDRYIKQE